MKTAAPPDRHERRRIGRSRASRPELLARDPENRLLARGPRARLEAEMVRDAALRASGLLSAKIGGPSVFPPQPPGVTRRAPTAVSHGRRARARTATAAGCTPSPSAPRRSRCSTTFDAPSGEACVARRESRTRRCRR